MIDCNAALCLAEELLEIDAHTALIDYHYRREKGCIALRYSMKRVEAVLKIRVHLPVSRVLSVMLHGAPVPYGTEAGFMGCDVLTDIAGKPCGRLEVTFDPCGVASAAERLSMRAGDTLALSFEGEIVLSLEGPRASRPTPPFPAER